MDNNNNNNNHTLIWVYIGSHLPVALVNPSLLGDGGCRPPLISALPSCGRVPSRLDALTGRCRPWLPGLLHVQLILLAPGSPGHLYTSLLFFTRIFTQPEIPCSSCLVVFHPSNFLVRLISSQRPLERGMCMDVARPLHSGKHSRYLHTN